MTKDAIIFSEIIIVLAPKSVVYSSCSIVILNVVIEPWHFEHISNHSQITCQSRYLRQVKENSSFTL